MKHYRKDINGIRYTAHYTVNADCSVTVNIKSPYSDKAVFNNTYSTSAESAVLLAWRDWDKERNQLMANKVKL